MWQIHIDWTHGCYLFCGHGIYLDQMREGDWKENSPFSEKRV